MNLTLPPALQPYFFYFAELPTSPAQAWEQMKASKSDSMFPLQLFCFMNFIFFIQIVISIGVLVLNGRSMPGSTNKWTLVDIGILGLLLTHTEWYILELNMTRMYVDFSEMAIHHLFSLVLFFFSILEPNFFSAIYLLPYLVHAFYWTLGAEVFEILFVYNGVFVFVGLVTYYHAVKSGSITRRIPLLAMAIITTNYFTYCHSYYGDFCMPSPRRTSTNESEIFYANGKNTLMVCLPLLASFIIWVEMKPWERTKSLARKLKTN